MAQHHIRIFLTFIILLIPSDSVRYRERSRVTLQVTSMMSGVFSHVTQRYYAENELPALWNTLAEGAAEFCPKYGPNRIPAKNIRQKFIKEEFFSRRIHTHRIETDFNKLIFGCRNFFQMNDVSPDKDFRLIAEKYPGEIFDCYTVGLMQAYIMSSIIPCRSMTVVDINWQILRAHHDLYADLVQRDQKAVNYEDIAKSVKLSFIANMSSKEAKYDRQEAQFSELCRDHALSMCEKQIQILLAKQSLPDTLELQLSHLKDADYHKNKHFKKVIFFSNALDPFYTSFSEFKALVANLNDSLTENNLALVIHHVGGDKTFGVYSVKKGFKNPSVSVLCRDQYRRANFPDQTYPSFFEVTWGYAKAPACQSLLK